MTEKFLYFIHPERKFLLWLAFLGILMLALYQGTKVSSPAKKRGEIMGYVPLAIALGCGVFAISPVEAKTQQTASYNNVSYAGQEIEERPVLESVSFGFGNDSDDADSSVEEMLQGDTYVFREDNYVDLLANLQEDPKAHVGKNVQIEGFVYREPDFADEEFVIARMYMLCCAADAQVVGLLVEWEDAGELRPQDWLQIEGVLDTKIFEMNGYTEVVPYIKVTKAEKIQTPLYPYVY